MSATLHPGTTRVGSWAAMHHALLFVLAAAAVLALVAATAMILLAGGTTTVAPTSGFSGSDTGTSLNCGTPRAPLPC